MALRHIGICINAWHVMRILWIRYSRNWKRDIRCNFQLTEPLSLIPVKVVHCSWACHCAHFIPFHRGVKHSLFTLLSTRVSGLMFFICLLNISSFVPAKLLGHCEVDLHRWIWSVSSCPCHCHSSLLLVQVGFHKIKTRKLFSAWNSVVRIWWWFLMMYRNRWLSHKPKEN